MKQAVFAYTTRKMAMNSIPCCLFKITVGTNWSKIWQKFLNFVPTCLIHFSCGSSEQNRCSREKVTINYKMYGPKLIAWLWHNKKSAIESQMIHSLHDFKQLLMID